MKFAYHIKFKYKILSGVVVLYAVFLSIILISYKNLTSLQGNTDQLKQNFQIQNGLIEIRDLVQKDIQKAEELADQQLEEDLEVKWKDHSAYQTDILSISKGLTEAASPEANDVAEIRSVYENIISPAFSELYKVKIKQIVVTTGDSLKGDLTVRTDMEIRDMVQEIRTKTDNLINKIIKTEDKLKDASSLAIDNEVGSIKHYRFELLIVSLLAIVFSIFFFYIFIHFVFRPFAQFHAFVSKLEKGDLSDELHLNSNDELGNMGRSLNRFVLNQKTIAKLLNDVGESRFDGDYQLLSEVDELGLAFIKMKERLQQTNEEARKMKEQESLQNWATTGVAKFGEILRRQTKDNHELAYNIIKALIEYVNANQGGLFIMHEDESGLSDPELQLMATYAYGRRKFKQRTVKIGEGLVGACALESETIYMTNIPEGYIEIESYLGHSSPKSLLIVPLKLDDKIFGIIELASFGEIKTHEIRFIEDLAGTIASTISTARINQRTSELLEKSRIQSEAMLAQEEEMRQNLEELQSTQEEAARRERILQEELQSAQEEIIRLRAKIGEE